MRAAIYARVSTEEQADEGHSIDAQLRLTREFCTRKGWTVIAEYVDPGFSGRTLNRPRAQEMLRDAHASAFDVIVVHKLDRLSRSLLDTLSTLADLNRIGVSFASATEDFDFTTPIGKVLLALLAAFAQYFIDNLRVETKKGKRERAMKGLYNGSLPFGYQRVPREQGGVPVPHPTNAEGYRLSVRLGAEGNSAREIVLALNAAGYRTTGNWGSRPFSEDTVLPMIKNRFYLGEVCYKGEWLPGKHEPLIDWETWERCQEQLRRRAAKRETTKLTDRVYPLRKLLHCARCGRMLRGHAIKGERRYRDPAKDYGENCSEPQSIKAEALEVQIGDHLSRARLPEDWKARILAHIGQSEKVEDSEAQKRTRLEGQLERAKRLFMLGDLTEREYLAQREQIQNALSAIRPSPMPDLERAAQLLANFGELWGRATDMERLKLLHAIIEKAWVKGGKIVAVEPRPAMYPLLAMASQADRNRNNDNDGTNSRGKNDEGMPLAKANPVAPARVKSHVVVRSK